MTFTLRQWLIIGGLIVGFAVAALIARGDGGGGSASTFDAPRWCSSASVLEGTGTYLDGSVVDATAADFTRVKDAIFEIENLAPDEIQAGLARLADLSLVVFQNFELEDMGWPEAYTAARAEINESEVDQAFDDLEREMAVCGREL